jgi:hypothetical protein
MCAARSDAQPLLLAPDKAGRRPLLLAAASHDHPTLAVRLKPTRGPTHGRVSHA